MGKTVKHRSRVAKDPQQSNRRQVHLMHFELFEELTIAGFHVEPGQMGENITVQGIDLLRLPTGTTLQLGAQAVLEITGLRNPCSQINDFQSGLLNAVLGRDENGHLIRRAGVMAIVRVGGIVRAGDSVRVNLPPAPHHVLEPV